MVNIRSPNIYGENCNRHFFTPFYDEILFLEVKNNVKFTGKTINWHSLISLHCFSNVMFLFIYLKQLFLLYFSFHQLCLLGLYVTSYVTKLMCIAYFSLLSVSMMVIIVCVNDAVLLLYLLIFKSSLWLVLVHHVTLLNTCYWWLSVDYKATKLISVLQ